MSTAAISVSITTRVEKFVKGMKRARRALRRFTKDVRVMAKRVAKMSAALSGLAIAATFAFAKVAFAGERFNRAMRRSQAIMEGLNAKIRKDMKRTAFEVARVTKFSAEQAAEAYFFLASAGLSAKQSIAALPQVAQFAQAGMFDMARATELVTDAQSALGLTVADSAKNLINLARVSDVLVKANAIANASTEEFAEALTTKAGAALKILNKDIEEGVAVLAAFADQGVKAGIAGTALNIVLRDLTTKALKNVEAFEQAQVAVFDSSGKMRNMAHIIADLEDSLSGMSDATKKQTLLNMGFADRSVIFIQTLIGMSRRIAEYERVLRRAGGTTARVSAKQLTPLEKSLAKLSAEWVRLGDAMQPVLGAIAFGIEGLAKKMRFALNFITPESVRDFVVSALNWLDQFFRKVKFAVTAFVQGLNETFASIFEELPFGTPKIITQNIATLRAELQRQSDAMSNALLGDRIKKFLDAAIGEGREAFVREQRESFVNTFTDFLDKMRFELARIADRPVTALLRLFGFSGRKLPIQVPVKAAVPVKAEPADRFRTGIEVNLLRQSIGMFTRPKGQKVHDPTNDKILDEMKVQTGLLREDRAAVLAF